MKKSDYKKQLIAALGLKGIVIDNDQLNSALSKVAIHARNKYGSANWEYELDESGVYNGISFYNDYKNKNTFNRQTYQQSRSKSGISKGC
jgi:hypothetical protein